MNPTLNVIISCCFIIAGFIGLLIMLNIQGNPKTRTHLKALRITHRVLGYLFLATLLYMIVRMAEKITLSGYEAPPRIALHIMLSIMAVAVLLIKILVARYFKKFYSYLVTLGLLVFFLCFTLVVIAAGPYLLQSSEKTTANDLNRQPVAEILKKTADKAEFEGEKLLKNKCTLCHTLERVEKSSKSNEHWLATLKKMIGYAQKPDYLTGEQIRLLAIHLSQK